MDNFSQSMSRLHGTMGWTAIAVLSTIGIVVIPVLNLAVPDGSFFHVSDFSVQLLGKYLCFAILAVGLSLIWGFTGILSLGQAVFFAFGAYCMGIHLLHNVVAGGTAVSDLTVLSMMDMREMPWFWFGFGSFAYTVLMVFAVPGLFAYLFGYLTFRSRVKGVYFSIITQAMTYALFLLFRQNDVGLGGTNGLTGFKTLLGFPLEASATKVGLLIASVLALLLVYLVFRFIVTSKLGRVLTCIRDAEARAMFSGYNPLHYKLFAWVFSAMACGLAGALFTPQVGIINPDELTPANSIDVAIWTALGGRGNLSGAMLGAGVVNGAKSWFSGLLENVWPILLGLIFVVIPIFLSKGLISLFRSKTAKETA